MYIGSKNSWIIIVYIERKKDITVMIHRNKVGSYMCSYPFTISYHLESPKTRVEYGSQIGKQPEAGDVHYTYTRLKDVDQTTNV